MLACIRRRLSLHRWTIASLLSEILDVLRTQKEDLDVSRRPQENYPDAKPGSLNRGQFITPHDPGASHGHHPEAPGDRSSEVQPADWYEAKWERIRLAEAWLDLVAAMVEGRLCR